MRDYLPSDINEEEELPVRGSLLAWLIERVRLNRWRTGWGLISEKGAAGGIISLDRSVLPDVVDRQWRGKVTTSSSTSEEHTIQEVNASDELIDVNNGGRKTTNAKAHNGRKGVPVDTILMVEESDYVDGDGNVQCYFDIPDGLTANPKDLVNTTTTANTDDWDVETQGSTEDGADFDPSRHALSIPAMFMYDRQLTVDSSGFVTKIGAERETFLSGDASDSPKDNHITLVTATSGGATGKDVKLNQAQATQDTITFQGTSGQINVTSSANGADAEFDNSGRYNDGTKTLTFSLDGDAGEPGGTLPTCTDNWMLIYNAGTATWDCIETVSCPTS